MLKLGIIAYNCTDIGPEPPVQGNKAMCGMLPSALCTPSHNNLIVA